MDAFTVPLPRLMGYPLYVPHSLLSPLSTILYCLIVSPCLRQPSSDRARKRVAATASPWMQHEEENTSHYSPPPSPRRPPQS